jgi:RNA polymerase sigma-70 factor (ECF subfamily)
MSEARQDVGDRLIAFLPNMRRFALSLVHNADVADDLVQQACERALAHADGFEPGTRFDAWILRILRNLWIDRMRREKSAGPSDDIEDHLYLSGDDGESGVEARLTLVSVSEAIARLPAEQREIIMLICVEELSYREAADILDVPIGTVMSRLARARRKLAELAGISGTVVRSSQSKGHDDDQT